MKPGIPALVLASLFGSGLLRSSRADESLPKTPAPYSDHLPWWSEGRFGIFIHWGPVSLKGTEISWSRANSNPKCPNKGNIPQRLLAGGDVLVSR